MPSGSMPSSLRSASVAPTIRRAATIASGTPVALATNGTVRDALGLASITNTSLAPGPLHRVGICNGLSPFRLTANCTFRRPFTSSSCAIRRVWSQMTATTSSPSVVGGIVQAESPECTPASSTCSITAPISTSPAQSRTASTSTSVASSRNRSTSTGRCDAGPPSRPSEPESASSSIAAASS